MTPDFRDPGRTLSCVTPRISGFSYLLDLTEQERDTDEKFDCHGISVVCDPKSYLYLNGTTVDFKDEVMGRGFVFNNPNATSSCGCGSSFSA